MARSNVCRGSRDNTHLGGEEDAADDLECVVCPGDGGVRPHHGHQVPHLFNTTVNIPPMEDDVAPDAVVEEGSDHVKEDVEDSGAFKMFNPVL